MPSYKQGSITDKINQLKSKQTGLTGTNTFDPNINLLGTKNVGTIGDQLLNTKPTSLIPNFTTPNPKQKSVVPIIPQQTKGKSVVPQIIPENLNSLLTMPPTTNGDIPPKPVESKDESDSNFLASLIGQGFAMMGAGIANRDPGAVGQQISQNRMNVDKFKSDEEQRKKSNAERLEQIERAKKLLDPTSNESKQKRMTYGKALGLDIPESTTAADLENSDFLRAMMQQNQMKMASMARGQGTGGSGTGGSGKPTKDPFTKEKAEINARSKTTLDNLDQLEKMIDSKGTFELTGSHNKNMDQLINSIAVNYNKVLDPTSVVREGEAKQIADNLGLSGMSSILTSNKSAKEQIRNFRELVKNTRNNQLSSYNELPTTQDFTPMEKMIVQDYKNNPDDPKVRSVYQNMVKSKGLGL